MPSFFGIWSKLIVLPRGECAAQHGLHGQRPASFRPGFIVVADTDGEACSIGLFMILAALKADRSFGRPPTCKRVLAKRLGRQAGF